MFGPREFALHRTDIDDPAALARDHVPRDRLPDEEHAVEVGAHQFAPGLLGEVLQRPAALDAGVVDENVDRPERRLDPRDRAGDRAAVGDVEDGVVEPRPRRRAGSPRLPPPSPASAR